MQFYSPLTVIVGHNGSGKTASSFFLLSSPRQGDCRLTVYHCSLVNRPSLNASSTPLRETYRQEPKAEPSSTIRRFVFSVQSLGHDTI